jgi:hypothetical protein
MRRQVTAHLELEVTEPALLALQVAVATPAADEHLVATRNGEPVTTRELTAPHHGPVHVLTPTTGHLVIDYSADVDGGWPPRRPPGTICWPTAGRAATARRTASWPPRRPSSAGSPTPPGWSGR